MTQNKPLPDLRDAETAVFWRGLRNNQLLVQQCENCLSYRYPAARICPECLVTGGSWTEVNAAGVLWSYVVYHRALSPAFAADVPYAVGVVEIEHGLHVLARVAMAPEQISIGAIMVARFEAVSEEITLLEWVQTNYAEATGE